MSISHIFEDFSTPEPEEPATPPQEDTADQYEELRLAEFEKGYSAGWEDAVNAQVEMKKHLGAELARNLEDLSFTYHEAIAQMTLSIEPVFRTLVDAVLPQALADSFALHLIDLLREMATETISGPLIITVPPGCAAGLQEVLDGEFNLPLELSEDPALAAGQADLRIGSAERELDTERLLADLRAAIEAFFYQSKRDSSHG